MYVLTTYEFQCDHSNNVGKMDKTMWLELDITHGIRTRHDLVQFQAPFTIHEVKIHFMVMLKSSVFTKSITPVYLTGKQERWLPSFWMLCTVHIVSAGIVSVHVLRF